MRYQLVTIKQQILEAWEPFFTDQSRVDLVLQDITTIEADAIVSPANSFGFMDGGLDYALSNRFGWDLQLTLQEKIKALPEGELLVGKALVIETGDANLPFLISAPTMRIPTNFNIATSVNAYLAMKATLIAAREHPKIESVAIPSFCTGVGGMDFDIAASQMFQAFREIELGESMDFADFGAAQKYHYRLNPLGMIWGSK